MQNVGNFTKFTLPLVRRVYPNLMASSIVSIQPMSQPVASIFYQGFKFTIDTPAEIYKILLHIAMQLKQGLKITYRIKKTNNELYVHLGLKTIRIKIDENKILIEQPQNRHKYITVVTDYLEDAKSLDKIITKTKKILNPKD